MSNFEATVHSLRGPDRLFSLNAPIYVSRAPGRLDVMGGNVDYTGRLHSCGLIESLCL
jgi:galactokinase